MSDKTSRPTPEVYMLQKELERVRSQLRQEQAVYDQVKLMEFLGVDTPGASAFTNAFVCVTRQGVASQRRDTGIDHWSIPASPTQTAS